MILLRALAVVLLLFGCSNDSLDSVPTPSSTPPKSNETPQLSNCEEASVLALRPEAMAPANLLMVVDRSGSMNEGTRWSDMQSSLQTITQELDEIISFGLMLFPAAGLNACGTGSVQVAPNLHTAEAINTALESTTPLGGTPTALSLKAAGEYLLDTNPDGPNYLLLATDGWPGCNTAISSADCICPPETNCILTSQNCLDDTRSATTVLQLREAGIFTYVIGIPGTEEITDLLDSMAVAGGTAIDSKHYQITNAQELTSALRSITGDLIPCIYDLGADVTTPQWLKVLIDGTPVQRDSSRENGWALLGRDRLAFFGTACQSLRDGNSHQIEAFIDCEAQ